MKRAWFLCCSFARSFGRRALICCQIAKMETMTALSAGAWTHPGFRCQSAASLYDLVSCCSARLAEFCSRAPQWNSHLSRAELLQHMKLLSAYRFAPDDRRSAATDALDLSGLAKAFLNSRRYVTENFEAWYQAPPM